MKFVGLTQVVSLLLTNSGALRVDLKPQSDGISPKQTINKINSKFDSLDQHKKDGLSVGFSSSSFGSRS